jgi:uncharacterized membrane protein SirB2
LNDKLGFVLSFRGLGFILVHDYFLFSQKENLVARIFIVIIVIIVITGNYRKRKTRKGKNLKTAFGG